MNASRKVVVTQLVSMASTVLLLIVIATQMRRDVTTTPHQTRLAPAVHATRPLGGSGNTQTACQSTGTRCARMIVGWINAERATRALPPLTLDWSMVRGDTACPGAAGHARDMAVDGVISHDQFPADICGSWSYAEENVGMSWGTKFSAISAIHSMMAAEPIDPGLSNHHTNWLSPSVSRIGIGFAPGPRGQWYLCETFAG